MRQINVPSVCNGEAYSSVGVVFTDTGAGSINFVAVCSDDGSTIVAQQNANPNGGQADGQSSGACQNVQFTASNNNYIHQGPFTLELVTYGSESVQA